MTLLFHCDESYDKRVHVHLGILSTGAQAAEAEHAVRELTASLSLGTVPGWLNELHGAPLFNGSDEWTGVDIEVRKDVYRQTLQIILDHELEVLYRGISMVGYKRRYTGSTNPKRDAFKFMFGDLLTKHLQRRCKDRGEFVLVVTDHQKQFESELRYAHAVTGASGRFERTFGIIDTCHFVNSKHSPLVQLADVAAFIQRRRLSFPVESDSQREAFVAEMSGMVRAAVPEPHYSHASYRRIFN